MTKEQHYGSTTWLDLENPSEKEVEEIIARFAVPTSVAEDLLSPTPRQRVLMYDNCVYLVLHFPTLSFHKNARKSGEHRKEIDFILGDDFLITAHYDPLTSIDKFSRSIKSAKEEDIANEGAAHFFHKLVKNLYHYLLHDIETIKDSLHGAEVSIFKGEEKRMVAELSKIHRDILRFNNALIPHRDAIETLKIKFKDFLGEAAEVMIRDIKSEYDRVDRRMAANKALLDELRHTNDSLLSAKQNEAIKGLTMMAFLTFPLSLVAAIFAIHANGTPVLHNENAFWIIISIMVAIMVACVSYFKYKKWL